MLEVEFAAAEARFRFGIPTTPWLVADSGAEATPPTCPALLKDPVLPDAVLVTAPAVEPTPPTNPPPLERTDEAELVAIPALPEDISESSCACAVAEELPIACTAKETGTVVPFFRTAWSNAKPREESG